MKKTLSSLALAFAFIATGYSQTTNTPPTSQTIWDFITTGSNYWAVPYMTYGVASHDFGGGIALGYKVSEIVNPVLRLDYFAGSTYLVSANAELQPPRSLMGKIPVIPFAIGGVGTSFQGLGNANGTAIGIVGAGAYVEFKQIGSGWFWQHAAAVVDYERWVGLPTKQADQIRAGIGISF